MQLRHGRPLLPCDHGCSLASDCCAALCLTCTCSPYLDLKIKYFDLSITNRDATNDKVTEEAAHAIKVRDQPVVCMAPH